MSHSKTKNNKKEKKPNWVDYIIHRLNKSEDVYHVNNIRSTQYLIDSISHVDITVLRDAVAQSEIELSRVEKQLEIRRDELSQSQCEKDLSIILGPLIQLFSGAENSLQESPQKDVQADEKCKQIQDQVAEAKKDYDSKFRILNNFRSKLDRVTKKHMRQSTNTVLTRSRD